MWQVIDVFGILFVFWEVFLNALYKISSQHERLCMFLRACLPPVVSSMN